MTDIARYPNIYAFGKGKSLQILPQYAEDVARAPPLYKSPHRALPVDIAARAKSGHYLPLRPYNSRLAQ